MTGTWTFDYLKLNGTMTTTTLHVTYQADLQDQTIGSATYGNYPDFIWVAQGGNATVNEGNYFASYRWYTVSSSLLHGGKTDSICNLGLGTFFSWTNDAAGSWTRDTISILEKPTFNNTAKTLSFPSTVSGITYKLLKINTVVGTDTIWTTAETYVGDGNAKSFILADGTYKLQVVRDMHSAVYPYGNFVVGTATAVSKVTASAIAYRLIGHKLIFNRDVHLQYYNLQGSLMMQGQGSEFKVPAGLVWLFVAVDSFGNTQKGKIGL
ncbi:MAG: hypothetical protein WCJ03_04800 [Bacteroidales bacterium]